MDAEQDRRGPGLRFPPPLIPTLVIVAGYLADRLSPLRIDDEPPRIAGALLLFAGVALAAGAVFQFLRARTHVEPWRPTTTIIRHGLFAWSRNPIYLAFCIVTAGVALILNSWWILAGIPLQVGLLQWLVISREETYLEARFGDEYRDYCQRVRRWF